MGRGSRSLMPGKTPVSKWIVIDFETASGCDLKKCGSYVYAEDPTTEITALAWVTQDGETGRHGPSDLSPTGRLFGLVSDPSVKVIAHNALFERNIWAKCMVPWGWPEIPVERWHDTMAVALMKGLPAKLDTLARAIHLDVDKDMEGSKLAVSLSKPNKKTGMLDRSETIMKRVLDYCAQDVLVEEKVLRFTGNFSGGEREVWELDQKINDRGIRIDTKYVHACLGLIDDVMPRLVADFRELTGVNPSQGEKFKNWLLFNGLQVPNLQKETISRLLGDEEDDYAEDELRDAIVPPDCRRALRLRKLATGAAVKKLPAMLSCAGADGRARGLLQYHGAGPGRWAGRILQPHNFPRAGVDIGDHKTATADELVAAIIERDAGYLRVTYGEPMEAITAGLRHALVADQDRTFLIADYAQIEARIVLAVAGQLDALKLFTDGDPYCSMAEQIFGHPVTKKEHPEKRQTGKNTILGSGFGMGKDTFFARYCHDRDLEFADMCIQAYRKKMAPKVPELWYGLEEAACRTVWDGRPHEYNGIQYAMNGPWLTARLPSGRRLWYFEPKRERRAMPWDKDDIRPAWSHMTFKAGHWFRRDAYGGLLTENVVQGMARDLLVHGMKTCEKEQFKIVLTVHDEAIAEDTEDRMKLFEECMKSKPQWAYDYSIPVAIEGAVTRRYKK